MDSSNKIYNVKSGNTLTLYSKSYQFLITTDNIINTSVITCYDESVNEYVFTPNNVNNQITLTNNAGKLTLNIKIIKNHIYTLTFSRKNTYSENKKFTLRVKGV